MTIQTIYSVMMPCWDAVTLRAKVFHALHGQRHVLRASFGGHSCQRSIPAGKLKLVHLDSMADRLMAKIRRHE